MMSSVCTVDGRIVLCRIAGELLVRKLITMGRGIRLQAGAGDAPVVPDETTFELVGLIVAHLGEL